MKNLIKLWTLIFIISSCSISNIKIETIKPAEINVPNHIESIIIVNRTSPKKNNKIENIIEGVLSGEMIGVDKKSSEDCINSLKLEMMNSPRFTLIHTESIEFKGSGTAAVSSPLKWEKIEKKLNSYEADALIVLESFDSSSHKKELGIIEKNRKIKGVWKKIKEHLVSLNIEVQAGWRIYDLKNKKIIDEKRFFDRKIFTNSDLTPDLAKQKLPSLGYAISEAAIFAGQQFYYRISPHYRMITREYFINIRNIKGFKIKSDNSNDLFIQASEYVGVQNWEEAIKIWKPLTDHKNESIASRACFNMALASEINGSIEIAFFWIHKSINLGNKKAKAYIKKLEERKRDLSILETQIN